MKSRKISKKRKFTAAENVLHLRLSFGEERTLRRALTCTNNRIVMDRIVHITKLSKKVAQQYIVFLPKSS
jgi:hypothetical protein